MKLTKKIIAISNNTKAEITLKVTTENLMRDESLREFNYILDDIADALLKRHHIADVKII